MFHRIISLVPSLTELLADMNLDNAVVGITKFCVHPPDWPYKKIIIGGTKSLDIPLIKSLLPDLILANKEENVKEQVNQLSGNGKLILTEPATCKQALQLIRQLGSLLEKTDIAEDMTVRINDGLEALKSLLPASRKRVAYFIWRKPYMVAGGDTFISSMLEEAGFENFFSHRRRYPEIALDELAGLHNLTIFLSSEPFPFSKKHTVEIRDVLPQAEIRLVDGQMFSWYGSRMLKAAQYFQSLHQI